MTNDPTAAELEELNQPNQNAAVSVPTSDELQELNQPAQQSSGPTSDELAELNSQPVNYSSPNQQALATAEGFGQGLAGPLESVVSRIGQAAPVESGIPFGLQKFGLTPQDIAARAQENPMAHAAGEVAGLASGLLTGTGEAALASKTAANAAAVANAGKIGSEVLKGAITNGLIQGSDEISNLLLNPNANHSDAVGAALATTGAGILGGAVGLGSNLVGKSLESLSGNKLLGKMTGFLSGIGNAAKETYAPDEVQSLENSGLFNDYDPSYGNINSAYDAGKSLFKNFLVNPVHLISTGAGIEGYREGGIEGALKNYITAEVLGKAVPIVSQNVLVPTITRAMASGTLNGIGQAAQHAINTAAGDSLLEKGINNLFETTGAPGVGLFKDYDQQIKKRQQLDDYLQNGGINQNIQEQSQQPNVPLFAEGGQVQSDQNGTMGNIFPTQNIMMNIAKGRINGYLQSLRPKEYSSNLIFDDPQPNEQDQNRYHEALDIANKPLSILNKIKQGTIEPSEINHFKSMFPETDELLQKKLTGKIIDMQQKGEKPDYHIRQGLSMLMGTSLSSDTTPQYIQAAQATFTAQQPSQQQGQPVTKNKKNTSTLTKAPNQYYTKEQARIVNSQRAN